MSDDPTRIETASERQLEAGAAQPRAAGKGPLILAKLVVSYLTKRRQGYHADYSELVKKLSSVSMPAQEMGRWLRALKLCVSYLTQDCEQLVAATLRLPWFTQSHTLVDLYLDYLSNLLSAQVCYVEHTLTILAKTLFSTKTLALAKGSDLEAIYSNIHKALKTLIDIVPLAAPQLVPTLNKHYPFKTRGPDIQEVAVRNCLHVATYCPTVSEDILYLLLNKMVAIDAEIKLDDEGAMEVVSDNEEGEGEEEGDTQFHVDMEQELAEPALASPQTTGEASNSNSNQPTTDGDDNRHGDEAPPPHLGPCYCVRQVMRNDMSENLDILMRVLQYHAHSTCFHNGKLVTEEAVGILQTLLKIFSSIVLPTHSISHVQFLLFYVTSFHKEFPGFFLDFLWKKFDDFNTPAVLRQTAAAYMASYVARSKFVSLETTKLCLVHMMQWIHQYLDMCDPASLGPFVAQHGPFFSLCQAVFYIFVFRHRSLVNMENGLSFLRNLNFERIVSSKLNPLKVCLPSVVERFTKIANQQEVVFCYTILEENRRLTLSLQASVGTQAESITNNHLDCFFPFDPYWLQRSSEVIHPLYQEWEEEEEEEGEGKEKDKMSDTEDVSSVLSSSCQSLGVSYEATPTHHETTPTHHETTPTAYAPHAPFTKNIHSLSPS